MNIRDKLITGTFAIGDDGQKEPTDWKEYAIKLEKEYASQQPSLRWTPEELEELISLAEDGYKLHVSSACHQEFLSEDLDILHKAKKWLSESSPTPKQEDEVLWNWVGEMIKHNTGFNTLMEQLKANLYIKRLGGTPKGQEVYSVPECVYQYCPHSRLCKNGGCLAPLKQSLPKQNQDDEFRCKICGLPKFYNGKHKEQLCQCEIL